MFGLKINLSARWKLRVPHGPTCHCSVKLQPSGCTTLNHSTFDEWWVVPVTIVSWPNKSPGLNPTDSRDDKLLH